MNLRLIRAVRSLVYRWALPLNVAFSLVLSTGCHLRQSRQSADVVTVPQFVMPFNRNDLDGWQSPVGEWAAVEGVSLAPSNRKALTFQPGSGVLVNGISGRTVNLLTEFQHRDVEAHIEFLVPEGSNSGVYFQGRYEIQVLDSWGVVRPRFSDCGGIYQRWRDDRGFEGRAPTFNASLPPGEWQTFDVTFRAPRFDAQGNKIENARFLSVTHNGVLVHEDQELSGPTRSAAFEEDERAFGPLMLQGDHGPVAYRNIILRSLNLP